MRAAEEIDVDEVARLAVAEIRALYGERLESVHLFGSRARGDAHPDSDVDLLVVLDGVDSRWLEIGRLADLFWAHSVEWGISVGALPVSRAEFDSPRTPALRRAKAEAQRVA
jgi:predicted nucleotidyltransferase